MIHTSYEVHFVLVVCGTLLVVIFVVVLVVDVDMVERETGGGIIIPYSSYRQSLLLLLFMWPLTDVVPILVVLCRRDRRQSVGPVWLSGCLAAMASFLTGNQITADDQQPTGVPDFFREDLPHTLTPKTSK